ncbi:hypothetical protein C8F01DRAFT_1010998, partial [Mycena amicta]
MLYRMILSTNPNTALVTRILGAYFALPDSHVTDNIRQGKVLRCVSFLDGILGLPVGTARRALRGLHSLFLIPSSNEKKMTPYHASLYDFLCSRSRSRGFFLDNKRHHEDLLERCLNIILEDLNGSKWCHDPHSVLYSSRCWHNHFMETTSSAQVNLLTSFLGQIRDLLTPQEFLKHPIMNKRIHGILDFLSALSRVYPGSGEYPRGSSYLTDTCKSVTNTLLLSVFDPTLQSRQFYNTGGSAYVSQHSSVSGPCPKVIHIQSTLGAVMRALTNPALPWSLLPQMD